MERVILFPMFIHSSKGGMQQIVLDLILGLNKSGWDCRLIGYKDSELTLSFKEKGVKTCEIQTPCNKVQWIRFIFSYYKAIFKYRKALIVTNDIFSHILLSLYPLSKKEIFVSHGGDYKSKGEKFAAKSGRSAKIARYTFERVTLFVAVSDTQREALINNAHVTPSKVVTIYNGYDSRKIRKAKKDVSSRIVNISVVGFIKPLKNQQVLLETIKELRSLNYNCILNLYGSISDQKYYDQLICDIKKLKIENAVVFHGYISDKDAIYNNTDILISCSNHEGFGLSLIEAMAYQVPTIGYAKSAGPSSIIENGKTGILVKENTSKAYKEAILQYLIDTEFKNNIIKNGLKKFQEKFSLNIMIEKYNNLFHLIYERS